MGTAAIQVGKLLGIEMYGTSSSDEKLARVKELGLGLVPSQAGQTIYLPDPATPTPANHTAGLYALGTPPSR